MGKRVVVIVQSELRPPKTRLATVAADVTRASGQTNLDVKDVAIIDPAGAQDARDFVSTVMDILSNPIPAETKVPQSSGVSKNQGGSKKGTGK
jgi:hypothetical protein